MKLKIIILLLFFIKLNAQTEDTKFLKQILKPVKYNNIEQDSIYLFKTYLSLDTLIEEGKFLHKESFKWWWDNMGGVHPPLFELFNTNFSDVEYNNEINLKRNDSIVHFNMNKIKKVDKNYISKYRDRFYSRISKPLFNKKKDWCIFIQTIFNPKLISSYEKVYIYVKIKDIWYEYHSFSKSFS